MPKGPRGEKRPADVIGGAIMVAKIATGEITEELRQPGGRRRSGLAGAAARAQRLTAEERSEVARKAAEGRWRMEDGKERVMMVNECDKLAERFKVLERQGLVDVKFLLRNTDEATSEQVCCEVNAMLDAFNNGEAVTVKRLSWTLRTATVRTILLLRTECNV